MKRRILFNPLISLAILSLLHGCAAGGTRHDVDLDLISDTVDEDAGELLDGPPECTGDWQCDDMIACTIDHCVDGICVHNPCADCCEEGLECIEGFGCGTRPDPCTTDEECSDGIRCTLDRCRDSSYCEHLAQDELCEEGEVCFPAIGCIPEPPETCESDEECVVGIECIGEWYCDPEFGCQFLSLLDCDDEDPCTDEYCDMDTGGCVYPIRDRDDDGYGDAECGEDDCDDLDPDIHPGATEECNSIDDDCDDLVDEDFECGPPSTVDACTTTCGTTGSHVCLGDCTWDECIPPVETCNGIDDDCDDVADEGWDCPSGSSGPCATMCGSTGSRDCLPSCTWDTCVPPAEICNGADDDCDGACDDGFACCRGTTQSCTLHGFFAGTAVCLSDCSGWDTSACTDCGNGTIDTGEECDVGTLGGHDCTTVPGGFAGGTLGCTTLCTFDTSGCHFCGNGSIDTGEDCDLPDMGGHDCTTIPGGFAGGSLGCTSGCAFDTSACHFCGNGSIDMGEDCDLPDMGGHDCTTIPGGFTGGTLGCTGACSFDTSACTAFDPSGVYVITPAPSYTCAFGLVNFFISTMTFTDSGASLVVTGAPCPMTGPSAMSTRNINVSCTLFGTCNETYALTGSYVSDTRWTGTFSATFVGSCIDCISQSWPVAGQK